MMFLDRKPLERTDGLGSSVELSQPGLAGWPGVTISRSFSRSVSRFARDEFLRANSGGSHDVRVPILRLASQLQTLPPPRQVGTQVACFLAISRFNNLPGGSRRTGCGYARQTALLCSTPSPRRPSACRGQRITSCQAFINLANDFRIRALEACAVVKGEKHGNGQRGDRA